MLFNSNINKVISSFDELKKISKKHITIQSKAFNNLESWAQDSNNNAIHDVATKLASLFKKLSDDFTKDKAGSFLFVSNLFRKFKEYDYELKSLQKLKISVFKKEQKYFDEIQKCPTSKNIRDYEVKHNKAKLERERAELKLYELSQEIDGAKSILFKRNMLSLTEALKRQNEAEKVLIEAMEKLLNQIPDVSNEEVDDIAEIKYGNKKQTDEICLEAKKKLTNISSSSLRVKNLEIYNETNENKIEVLSESLKINLVIGETSKSPSPKKNMKAENKKPSLKTQSRSSRISCPPKITFINEQNENGLYPCLSGINEEPPQVPPPTYSDSENFYTTIKAKSSSVLPSAPCMTDVDSGASIGKYSNKQSRNINSSSNIIYKTNVSPTRNI